MISVRENIHTIYHFANQLAALNDALNNQLKCMTYICKYNKTKDMSVKETVYFDLLLFIFKITVPIHPKN